jgi:hypothetical protein
MHRQMKHKTIFTIIFSTYVTLTRDEITIVDNGNWISIHAYITSNSVCIPIMISLQEVVSRVGVDNLTTMIMNNMVVVSVLMPLFNNSFALGQIK